MNAKLARVAANLSALAAQMDSADETIVINGQRLAPVNPEWLRQSSAHLKLQANVLIGLITEKGENNGHTGIRLAEVD